MSKQQFLAELRTALAGLPQDDIEERLNFYGEMIDDRMEEGLTESEAVEGIGSVSDIAEQTLAEIPLAKLVKERMAPKRSLRGWEIALLVLGFPLWFPLIIAACAVVLALYVVILALIISLWAIEIALWACAVGGVCMAAVFFTRGEVLPGLAILGAALVCAGLALLMLYACIAATKGLLRLTKKMALGIKSLFVGKEKKQ